MSERSTSQTPNPERIVLVGYGPVGARFVEELLPLVRRGAATLTVVGAENTDAYNRVLIAEHAVGNADRDSLEITDTFAAREAGVHLHLGVSVTAILRSRSAVSLSDGTLLTYDRLVLATGARANIPTLDGIIRVHRDRQMPAADAAALDTGGATLPRGVTVLRDLDDAQRVLAAVTAGKRIVVLGAGVLGMEIALAAASAGAQACVVYHGEIPMNRNLDRGGGSVLAQSARRAGVTMVNHSRAESLLFHQDDDGVDRFDVLSAPTASRSTATCCCFRAESALEPSWHSWPGCRFRPESWSIRTCRAGAIRASTRSATAPTLHLPAVPVSRQRCRPAARAV